MTTWHDVKKHLLAVGTKQKPVLLLYNWLLVCSASVVLLYVSMRLPLRCGRCDFTWMDHLLFAGVGLFAAVMLIFTLFGLIQYARHRNQ